ncbi:hypothetical protein FQN60_014812, partial [Etheostoma spectabile]
GCQAVLTSHPHSLPPPTLPPTPSHSTTQQGFATSHSGSICPKGTVQRESANVMLEKQRDSNRKKKIWRQRSGCPAVAPGYRSQLGNAEMETMRREGEEDEGEGRATDQRHPGRLTVDRLTPVGGRQYVVSVMEQEKRLLQFDSQHAALLLELPDQGILGTQQTVQFTNCKSIVGKLLVTVRLTTMDDFVCTLSSSQKRWQHWP